MKRAYLVALVVYATYLGSLEQLTMKTALKGKVFGFVYGARK